MTTHEPASTAVGTMYDQFTGLLTDVLGGSIHVGYWDDKLSNQPIETATDRLTSLVADRLALKSGQCILDVGCGTGKPAVQIATTHDVHVIGITVSNHQMGLAQARPGSGTQPGQVCFQFADAMDLPFADTSFDGAYAIESLCHMSDKSAALAQITRVLRPGSRLVIADVFFDESAGGPDAPTMSRICQLFQTATICTANDYRDLLHQAGLRIIEFTDIQHNVRRTYEILATALCQMTVLVDVDLAERLRGAASDLEQLKQLGYALITVARA